MYLVGNRCYRHGDSGLEQALALAQSGRALCLCDGIGIPVYVSRHEGRRVLKRMPGTGFRHAADCPHHRHAEREATFAQTPVPPVLVDPGTGRTHVRVDFPLTMSSGTSHQSMAPGGWGVEMLAHGPRFSLGDLLLFLWRRAELTRWHPSFEGKRTWGVIRRHLLRAADGVCIGHVGLPDILFVPEPFAKERADAIDARIQQRFVVATCRRAHGRQPLLLMCAELKTVSTTSDAETDCLILKHLPRLPIRIDLSRADLPQLPARPSDGGHVVIAATIAARGGSPPSVVQLATLETFRTWVPRETRTRDNGRAIDRSGESCLDRHLSGPTADTTHRQGNVGDRPPLPHLPRGSTPGSR